MSRFLDDLELMPLLRGRPSAESPQSSDEFCSPAHVFLAIAKLRASATNVHDLETRLYSGNTLFHQMVAKCALTVLDVANGMGMLFTEHPSLPGGLINHQARTALPPEATVEAVCRQIADEQFGW